MARLNQVVAIEKTAKSDAAKAIARVYHLLQKGELFAGVARTYQPLAEDGVRLPPESVKVKARAADLLADELRLAWVRLLDLVATKDLTNTKAKADIVVEGSVLATDVPVTYLLWLEKQLVDLSTLISKLPILDTTQEWHQDPDGVWATPVKQTVKTTKLPRNHVLAEATKEHPAQVQMYTEDVPVGTWSTITFSGAMPGEDQRVLLARVAALQAAVKIAREEANMAEVTEARVGAALFGYLLA